MARLSEHFTLEELTLSQVAARLDLDNTPPAAVKKNLKALAVNVLEPVRALAEKPISVSSGYRAPEVNKAVGGSPRSQHMKGEAADINCFALGQKKLFDLIRRSGVPYDQVIDEFGRWVHVSFAAGATPRRQALRARVVDGETKFTPVVTATKKKGSPDAGNA